MLELAILGLLQESPMHGYELRRRLNAALGAFRALSFGTLYPCLKALLDSGLIVEDTAVPPDGTWSRRARRVYRITAEGKEQFQTLMEHTGPMTWEDDTFDVHFAFFGRASGDVRLRILEGRRSRLEERLDAARQVSRERRERLDAYTAELQRHGLEEPNPHV